MECSDRERCDDAASWEEKSASRVRIIKSNYSIPVDNRFSMQDLPAARLRGGLCLVIIGWEECVRVSVLDGPIQHLLLACASDDEEGRVRHKIKFNKSSQLLETTRRRPRGEYSRGEEIFRHMCDGWGKKNQTV